MAVNQGKMEVNTSVYTQLLVDLKESARRLNNQSKTIDSMYNEIKQLTDERKAIYSTMIDAEGTDYTADFMDKVVRIVDEDVE